MTLGFVSVLLSFPAYIPRVDVPFLTLLAGWVAPVMAVVALILGGMGIVAKGRRRSFAVLGTALSLVVLSGFFYALWTALTKS